MERNRLRFYTFAIVGVLLTLACSLQAQPHLMWQQNYGGEDDDYGYNVIVCNDGGFLELGSDNSFGPVAHDAWVVKTNADGDSLWSREYTQNENPEFGQEGYFADGCQLANGDFILAGGSTPLVEGRGNQLVFHLVKTDSAGEVIWDREYVNHHEWDWLYCMKPTTDGGFSMSGEGYGEFGFSGQLYLVKTDAEGQIEWVATTELNSDSNEAFAHIQTADGGYAMVGRTDAAPAERLDGCLVKLDDQGQIQWIRNYGSRQDDYLMDIIQTPDSGYAMVGLLNGQAWLLKVDAEGEVQWQRTFDQAHFEKIVQSPDGGFIVGGNDGLVRTDAQGEVLWSALFHHERVLRRDYSILWGRSMSFRQLPDNGLIIATTVSTNGNNMTLIRLSTDPTLGIPVWSPLPDTGFVEDSGLILDANYLFNFIEDWDTPDSALTIEIQDGAHVSHDFDGNELILSAERDWWGNDTLTVDVRDPEAHTARTYWNITVTSVNDPPSHFGLLLPANGDVVHRNEETFLWETAVQNRYETDSVRYSLRFSIDQHQYTFRDIPTNMYEGLNLQSLLDSLGVSRSDHELSIQWDVTAQDAEFTVECDTPFTLIIPSLSVPLSGWGLVATTFDIASVYPNPFNSSTTIRFGLDKSAPTRLAVYDIDGRLVQELVNGRLTAGEHRVVWNADKKPSGVYLCRLESAAVSRSAKLVLMR
jgi:hypothetical protein